MPRAEVGSNKHLANKMKSKGLQRLRWYCQVCEKQCRDANGFKCHTQSESHIRQMQIVGEDAGKYIRGYSNDFQRDFVALLRVSHSEKYVGVNRFYNEYIREKEHIHMNATKWSSLTEFAKHLGREGIVNVKEDEKDGLMIAWRDTSAKALERREAIRAADEAEARSGAGGDKMLKKMSANAKRDAEERQRAAENFARVAEARAKAAEAKKTEDKSASPPTTPDDTQSSKTEAKDEETPSESKKEDAPKPAPVKMSFGLKPKNAAAPAPAKSQNIFKRVRSEGGGGNPLKKVKV